MVVWHCGRPAGAAAGCNRPRQPSTRGHGPPRRKEGYRNKEGREKMEREHEKASVNSPKHTYTPEHRYNREKERITE